MVGIVVEGATPRQTIDASPTSTDASTLLWSRIIIFTVSQNWGKKKKKVQKVRFKEESFGCRAGDAHSLGTGYCPSSHTGSPGGGEEPGWHRIGPSISPGTACGSSWNLQLPSNLEAY